MLDVNYESRVQGNFSLHLNVEREGKHFKSNSKLSQLQLNERKKEKEKKILQPIFFGNILCII